MKDINLFINKIVYQRDKANLFRNSIALRTLLASIVCLSHQLYIFSNYHTMLLDTRLAVAAFFFISGFSIANSLNRRNFDLNGLKIFFKARFKRVYVPYVVLILLQTIIFSLMYDAEIKHALQYFKFNFLLLNYYYPFPGESFQFPVNGSLWSLKWEVLCYILSPLLFFISLHKKWNKPLFVALMIAIFSSSFLDYVYTNRPLFLIFIFFVGFRLYFFHSLVIEWITKNPVLLGLSLVGYAFMYVGGFFGGIYLGILLVYYLLNNFDLDKWIKNDISYSIYIVHFPIAVLARKWMGIDPVQNPFYFGLLFLTSLLFAYLFAQIVEKKLTGYLFPAARI